ncbi:MAG TPA: hypothetical protein VGI55_05660 [Solirubrobacteraceae bacterium]
MLHNFFASDQADPRPPGIVVTALVAAVLVGVEALGIGGVAVSAASTRAGAAATKPPMTVTASLITRKPDTLAPRSLVRPFSVTGPRVFTDAKHGFALVSLVGADYAVATADGGKTWKTDGPALHLHAAQAPLAVVYLGAVSRRTLFAWGGGQVIDTTSDGGKTWYSALFSDGSPVAVAHDLSGHLTAFVGSFGGTKVWQYVSGNGGRTWRYQMTVGR